MRNVDFDPNDIIREQEFTLAEGKTVTAICYEEGDKCRITYWLNKTTELHTQDITKEYDIGISSATLDKMMTDFVMSRKDSILSETPW